MTNCLRLDLVISGGQASGFKPIDISAKIQDTLGVADLPWGNSVQTHEFRGDNIRFRINPNKQDLGITPDELLHVQIALFKGLAGIPIMYRELSYGENRQYRDL